MNEETDESVAVDDTPTVDWLAMARDAYSSSKPYLDSYLRPQWEKNLRQWQGKHSSSSRYESKDYGKSKLFRPRTRSVTRKNEASAAVAYLATEDVVSVSANDDGNELDKLTAEIAHNLLNQRLKKTIPWFHTVVGAFQTAQIYGEVVSYQYWDVKKDKPCIDLVPPENFRIDPAADWIDPIGTSPYLIHLMPMYIMDVRDYEGWNPVSDAEMLAASSEYSDSTRITREDNRDSKSSSDAQVTDYSIVWVRRYIIKQGGQDWVFYTLGEQTMLSEPVPLVEAYWHGERPYVMGSCIIEAFKPHPSGVPEIIADVQKEINSVCNQRMDNVNLAMNKRYFAKRGAQVDLRSITRNISGSVTLMNDPATDVIVHSTPDVTASSFQEQDRLNLDFDDLAGTFSGSSVQANRSLNETVGGMNMMSQGANQVAEYQLKTFNETWAEPVLRQMVKLELLYETDQAILKTAGENSDTFKAYGFEMVTEEMLSGDFTLNVNVGTGAANPQSQVERFFYGLQTLTSVSPDIIQQLNIEEVVKEVFGKLGYKDGKRFFNFDGDPQTQQLQQQIQQLQQELTNKRNPELDSANVKLIDAQRVKVLNESQYNALQTAQTIVQVPGAAAIADVIMQNSGFVMPSESDDPNFPQTVATQAQQLPEQQVNQNTSPMLPPISPSPNIGAQQGVETQRVTDNLR